MQKDEGRHMEKMGAAPLCHRRHRHHHDQASRQFGSSARPISPAAHPEGLREGRACEGEKAEGGAGLLARLDAVWRGAGVPWCFLV